MWDLKLNNACNHRIINEPLKIEGSYPSYYATLKRPVYGNNLEIKIVDEDNLFSINPLKLKTIFCSFNIILFIFLLLLIIEFTLSVTISSLL